MAPPSHNLGDDLDDDGTYRTIDAMELDTLVEEGAAALAEAFPTDYLARDILCAAVGLFAQDGDSGDQLIAERLTDIRRTLIGMNAQREIAPGDVLELLSEVFAPAMRGVILHAIARARIQAAFVGIVPFEFWERPSSRW